MAVVVATLDTRSTCFPETILFLWSTLSPIIDPEHKIRPSECSSFIKAWTGHQVCSLQVEGGDCHKSQRQPAMARPPLPRWKVTFVLRELQSVKISQLHLVILELLLQLLKEVSALGLWRCGCWADKCSIYFMCRAKRRQETWLITNEHHGCFEAPVAYTCHPTYISNFSVKYIAITFFQEKSSAHLSFASLLQMYFEAGCSVLEGLVGLFWTAGSRCHDYCWGFNRQSILGSQHLGLDRMYSESFWEVGLLDFDCLGKFNQPRP